MIPTAPETQPAPASAPVPAITSKGLVQPAPEPAKAPRRPLPKLGAIVLYRLTGGPCAGEYRPAIVTRVNDDEKTEAHSVNLSVALDGGNDDDSYDTAKASPSLWRNGVLEGEEPGTWKRREA